MFVMFTPQLQIARETCDLEFVNHSRFDLLEFGCDVAGSFGFGNSIASHDCQNLPLAIEFRIYETKVTAQLRQ